MANVTAGGLTNFSKIDGRKENDIKIDGVARGNAMKDPSETGKIVEEKFIYSGSILATTIPKLV